MRRQNGVTSQKMLGPTALETYKISSQGLGVPTRTVYLQKMSPQIWLYQDLSYSHTQVVNVRFFMKWIPPTLFFLTSCSFLFSSCFLQKASTSIEPITPKVLHHLWQQKLIWSFKEAGLWIVGTFVAIKFVDQSLLLVNTAKPSSVTLKAFKRHWFHRKASRCGCMMQRGRLKRRE